MPDPTSRKTLEALHSHLFKQDIENDDSNGAVTGDSSAVDSKEQQDCGVELSWKWDSYDELHQLIHIHTKHQQQLIKHQITCFAILL